MKKRILSILLAFIMVVGMLPATVFAAGNDHEIKLELVKDSTTFSGQDVLRVDFLYKSGSDEAKSQEVWIKFDDSKLTMLYNDGTDGSADLTTLSVPITDYFMDNLYDNGLSGGSMRKNSMGIMYGVLSGGYGYINWKNELNKAVTEGFSDFTCMSSIFFSLDEGVSFDALPMDAITFATVAADSSVTNQTYTALVSNGTEQYMWGSSGSDALTVIPAITAGTGVTFSKPAYSGTQASAPTAASNTGGKIVLTSQDITGETVEYAVTAESAAEAPGTGWQDSTTFDGLTVGTTYKFWARVKETSGHQAGTAASALITANPAAVTSVEISGGDSATVPTEALVKATVNLTAKANYDNGSDSDVTATAAWSVVDEPAGVTVDKGVVTITPDASAGNVTIKAEYDGKNDTHTITLSKAAAELNTITVSGPASVSVPGTYDYTATGKDQYGKDIATGTVAWSVLPDPTTGVSISADGKLTVTNAASAVDVVIKAAVDTVIGSKTVQITKDAPAAASLSIQNGVTELTVPTVTAIGEVKKVDASAKFTAELKDQYGDDFSGTVTWKVTGNSGVTISQDGLLTISSEATDDAVTVTATCGILEDSKAVTINKASSTATFIQILKDGDPVPENKDTITIPTSGSAMEEYTAKVYDQYGAPFTAAVTWSIEAGSTGAEQTDGTVTVPDTASEGDVKLTAAVGSTLKAEVTITLSNMPKHVLTNFSSDALEYTYGDTVSNTQTVSCSTGGTVKYSSSNPSAVEVNETSGALTIKAATTAPVTITASVAEGNGHAANSKSYTVTVKQKTLTITGLTAVDRAYNGSADVALTGGALSGVIGTDVVSATMPTTGTMANPNAGSGKAVTVTKPALTGSAADNYTLADIDYVTVNIAKADPDVGTVSGPATDIYTSTPLASITLTHSGETAGEVALDAGQTLRTGTNSYDWTFKPTDTTNYNQATGTVSLTVKEDALTSITVTGTPTKTAYKYGEDFETDGLTVTANYASGATQDVTGQVTFGDLAVGDTSIVLSYQGKTCTVNGITVAKADAPELTNQHVKLKYTVTSGEKSVSNVGMPADAGELTYTKNGAYGNLTVNDSDWNVDANGLVTWTLTGGTVGTHVELVILVHSNNYTTQDVVVYIDLTAKDTPEVHAEDITVTYNGEAIPDSAITGTAKFDSADVPGTWSWEDAAPKNVLDSGSKSVVFTPDDTSNFETVTTAITVTIKKADPTGTPGYTAITESGKTLADAALTAGSITPAGGEIKWDLGDSQTVAANTAYDWTYTPADEDNYNTLTGSITPYVVSYSGGGGGGGGSVAYSITVETAQNGTITVSPKSTSKGSTVTITVKPDAGYELEALKAVDKNGAKIAVTEKNGKYTFTMPASKVTVSGTFVKTEAPAPEPENPFTDVKESDYFYNAALWALDEGITAGTSATTFSPDASCTRAQMVTFLWRAAGSPAPKSSANPFVDVKAGAYYYDAVLWAVEQGITAGTSATTFGPDASCTRAQSVTFLYRFAGSPAVSKALPFTDVADSDWYAQPVKWALEEGITAGTSATTFSPNATCTRAQIVTFLFRLLGE